MTAWQWDLERGSLSAYKAPQFQIFNIFQIFGFVFKLETVVILQKRPRRESRSGDPGGSECGGQRWDPGSLWA